MKFILIHGRLNIVHKQSRYEQQYFIHGDVYKN